MFYQLLYKLECETSILSYFTTFSKYLPRRRDAAHFILIREEIGWKKGQFQPRDFNRDETTDILFLDVSPNENSTIHIF